MDISIRQATHPGIVRDLDSAGLRQHFLVPTLFRDDDAVFTYSHVERLLVGGVKPVTRPVALDPHPVLGRDPFLARRELGTVNIGGPGRLTVDGVTLELGPRDGAYVPMGSATVSFASLDPTNPAKFYVVSSPAHARHALARIGVEQARPKPMGAPETSNERVIYQYVNPDICQSSQLLLGLTSLKPGSVWNTMPCHIHDRRSEVYFYFDMRPDDRVFHFMGDPAETRHLVLANEQAAISPPWSIHTGCGTASYSFIWAMAGENQDYTDMQAVPMTALR